VGFIGWLVVGFVAGALAQRATGVRGSGCLFTLLVGVLGGLLGGAIFNLAGDEGIGELSLKSVLVAFVGAAVLLLVAGPFVVRRERR
jgi:uncharacterized membrane protein YeaQ/YmgE (transglycosylase-associated protein family)